MLREFILNGGEAFLTNEYLNTLHFLVSGKHPLSSQGDYHILLQQEYLSPEEALAEIKDLNIEQIRCHRSFISIKIKGYSFAFI